MNGSAQTVTVRTGLRKGTYCDVVHGCAAAKVVVDAHGMATVTVPGKDAVAIDVDGRR